MGSPPENIVLNKTVVALRGRMIRYAPLSHHPEVFHALTGLTVSAFDGLLEAVLPNYLDFEHKRLNRPGRRRAVGAGHPFTLSAPDQVLLGMIWLHHHPSDKVLGYLFGISDTTALRVRQRVLPVLKHVGRDTTPRPGPHRSQLNDLLREAPGLALFMNVAEQPRP